MPPKKILVVRQKLKSDGSVTLEPVAWKDEKEVSKPSLIANTSIVRVEKNGNETHANETDVISLVVRADGSDPMNEDDDVDFLSSGPCDADSVAESVENDKMLNNGADPLERDWFSGEFGQEVIDEMLGSGFTVSSSQEENLVPELGITAPIEDASLAALKYSPEKTISKKARRRPARELTTVQTTPRSPAKRTALVTYPRKCDYCDKICHTKNQYKSHRFYHHTQHRFLTPSPGDKRKCDFCDKTFSMKAAFVKHQRTLHWKELELEEPRFPCRWCDRVYVASSSRIYHEMTIHRPKQFPCPLCGITFKAYENLNKHLKTHNASCLRCCKCHNLFTNVDSLRKHFINKHPDMEFDDSCIITNENANKRLVNGQAFVPRKSKPPSTMTFESIEKLDEFLHTNPNYQIVQTDENGQVMYQLVETIETTDMSLADQITEANTITLPDDEFMSDQSTNHELNVHTIFMSSENVTDNPVDVDVVENSEANSALEGETEIVVPEFELRQVEANLAAIPNLQGKLAYRCQVCSMVYEDAEALMKHCLLRHQEIAQVVFV